MSAIFGSDDGFDDALADANRQLRIVEGGKGKRKGGGRPPPESPPEDLDWDKAPIECLGVQGETWWFRDAYHQIVGIAAAKLSQRGPLNVLLAGDADGWAARHWPEYDREGLRTGDFTPRKVHKAIAARMLQVGAFDPSMPRRGPGVWLHDGAPVVHCGNQVLFAEATRKPSFIRDGILYVSGPQVPLPHDGGQGRLAPPGPGLAHDVEALLRNWNWDAAASDKALLGWLTIANLGALAPMRPLGIVDGQEGGGKTTLLRCIAALCPAALWTDDATESGLRQAISQRAGPVVLDEFEGEEQVRVLGLLRRIVTGDGSRSYRGQASQQALMTEVVGTAIMGAIGAPVANAAETTRILNVMLWPRSQGSPPLDGPGLVAQCRTMAAPLWGRAIAAWPRIRANVAVARQVLDSAGCSPRYMDMLGWLIAAREAMVSDDVLTPPQAMAAVDWAWPWVVTEDQQAEDSTAARCLQHLMATSVMIATAHTETVASLVTRALREPDTLAERLLHELGMRLAPLPVEGPEGRTRGLYIAIGRRPSLNRVFAGTEWQGGRWGTVLAQMRRILPGGAEYRAAVLRTRIRFSGENDRAQAVWLAPELLPGHGHGKAEDRF